MPPGVGGYRVGPMDAPPGSRSAPRTLLCLMGSGEFEPWTADLERELLREATGDGSVAIVATASAAEGPTYHEWIEKALAHYGDLGVAAHVADIRGRDDAHREDAVAAISRASLVFVSGGDAAYLATSLAETPAWEAIRDLLERGGGLAGCSAGAMVLGEAAPPNMLVTLRIEDVAPGFGLLPGTWVWPHWDETPEEAREHLIGLAPGAVDLLLLDRETAAISLGGEWRTVGRGRAEWIHRTIARERLLAR